MQNRRPSTIRTRRTRVYRRGLAAIPILDTDLTPFVQGRFNTLRPIIGLPIRPIGTPGSSSFPGTTHTPPFVIPSPTFQVPAVAPPAGSNSVPTPIPDNGPLPPGNGYQQIEAPGNPYPYVYIGSGTAPAPPPAVAPTAAATQSCPNIYFDQNYQMWRNQLTGQFVDPLSCQPLSSVAAGTITALPTSSAVGSGFSANSALQFVENNWIWFAAGLGGLIVIKALTKGKR